MLMIQQRDNGEIVVMVYDDSNEYKDVFTIKNSFVSIGFLQIEFKLSGFDIVLFKKGTEIMVTVPKKQPRKTTLIFECEHTVIEWPNLPENFNTNRFLKKFLKTNPNFFKDIPRIYSQKVSEFGVVHLHISFPPIPERHVEFRNMNISNDNIVGDVCIMFADNDGIQYSDEILKFSVKYNLSK